MRLEGTEYAKRRAVYRRGLERERWNRVRMKVLMRDPVCTVCGKRPSKEVDHRFPEGGLRERWEKNGYLTSDDRYNPDNLEGLCHRCHAERTEIDRKHRQGNKREE